MLGQITSAQQPLAKSREPHQSEGMAQSNVVPFQKRSAPASVSFDRKELGAILSKYGQLVAAGEWRDYSLTMEPEKAEFCVYRRSGDTPDYRIEKRPKNASKQGQYAIIGGDGRMLKRGHDLKVALRFFDRKLLRIADEG